MTPSGARPTTARRSLLEQFRQCVVRDLVRARPHGRQRRRPGARLPEGQRRDDMRPEPRWVGVALVQRYPRRRGELGRPSGDQVVLPKPAGAETRVNEQRWPLVRRSSRAGREMTPPGSRPCDNLLRISPLSDGGRGSKPAALMRLDHTSPPPRSSRTTTISSTRVSPRVGDPASRPAPGRGQARLHRGLPGDADGLVRRYSSPVQGAGPDRSGGDPLGCGSPRADHDHSPVEVPDREPADIGPGSGGCSACLGILR
jgi:hypothetical protein